MVQWKVPGLFGTSFDSQRKDIIKFPHRYCPYKTKSSILTFTKKGGKQMSMNGGTLELNLSDLTTSLFKLLLLSFSGQRLYTLESLLLISIPRVFVCAILVAHPSIIREKTLNSHFPHHFFISPATLYLKLIWEESLGTHLGCKVRYLIFLSERGGPPTVAFWYDFWN